MTRTWLTTDSFPEFCPCFQLKDQLEEAKYASRANHMVCPLVTSLPTTSQSNSFHSEPSFFQYKALPLLWLPWSFCPNASDSGWLPQYSKFCSICSHLNGPSFIFKGETEKKGRIRNKGRVRKRFKIGRFKICMQKLWYSLCVDISCPIDY